MAFSDNVGTQTFKLNKYTLPSMHARADIYHPYPSIDFVLLDLV